MKKSVPLALILATATLVAACDTTVTGEPAPGPSASSAAAAPSVAVPAGLDTGTYPTSARTVPPATSDESWVAEGNRMADEALIQANEVDPRLVIGGAALRSFPVLTGVQLNSRVPTATYRAFSENTMRVGMTTTRGDKLESPTVAVRIGLYRFDSPQYATKAVEAIRRNTTAQRRVEITGAPKALAGEFTPGTVDSYLAEGEFVINVSGTGPTTSDGAGLVSKAFALELPKLKAFTPTPASSIASLSADKEGIVSRTLPLPEDTPNAALSSGYFGLQGLRHRIPDISQDSPYTNAGVDLVGQGANAVYRTRDDQAALTFVKELSAKFAPVAGIPSLPTVTCKNNTVGNMFWCYVPVGRYVSTVSDSNEAVAKQKAAAQFTVLATAK